MSAQNLSQKQAQINIKLSIPDFKRVMAALSSDKELFELTLKASLDAQKYKLLQVLMSLGDPGETVKALRDFEVQQTIDEAERIVNGGLL